MKSLLTGEFEKKYIPTVGVEVHPVKFYTNQGPICFNVWDCAGQEELGGLRDGYYMCSDAGIYFGKDTSFISDFKKVSPTAPIVSIWSKADTQQKPKDLEGNALSHSTKSRTNYVMPFLQLAQILLKSSELEFTEAPSILPSQATWL